MPDEKPFSELAAIAQGSFEDRRRYEWKLNFSVWASLGLLAYWATSTGTQIFDPANPRRAYMIGALLLVLYTLSFCLIAKANIADKNWKH